ncbi:S-layer homology domain-containing protein, partial [Veillonella caviae]
DGNQTTTTVKDGAKGEKGDTGAAGQDGKNATASVTNNNDGTHTITIIDGNGKETTTIVKDGATGYRVFESDSGSDKLVTVELHDPTKSSTNSIFKLNGYIDDKVSGHQNIHVENNENNDGFVVRMDKNIQNIESITFNNSEGNPSIKITGDSIDMAGNKITNLAPGEAGTDAVNVNQLRGSFNKLDNKINHAGANAAALAALHPLDFDPDEKLDFAIGYGNYSGTSATAIGAYYRPNEDTMFSVGATLGGGENMFNAGLSFKVGQANHVSTSRVAMAKEMKDMRATMAAQDAKIAELTNLVNKLVGMKAIDYDLERVFPDIPENHWAYDYVSTLAGNGIIEGYPNGYFDGNRTMTRYEMAAVIYRALQNGAAQDANMMKALNEFKPELERFRVDTISKHKDGTPDIQRVRVIKDRG